MFSSKYFVTLILILFNNLTACFWNFKMYWSLGPVVVLWISTFIVFWLMSVVWMLALLWNLLRLALWRRTWLIFVNIYVYSLLCGGFLHIHSVKLVICIIYICPIFLVWSIDFIEICAKISHYNFELVTFIELNQFCCIYLTWCDQVYGRIARECIFLLVSRDLLYPPKCFWLF